MFSIEILENDFILNYALFDFLRTKLTYLRNKEILKLCEKNTCLDAYNWLVLHKDKLEPCFI